MYLFLEKDFEDLCVKINELNKKLAEIGQEIGESCRQSSETYHDNFPFEEGRRQQNMVSERMNELVAIKNQSRIVSPDLSSNVVSIGKVVVIKDKNAEETETYKLGSYMIFNRLHGYISYASPLAKIIAGAKSGEVREGEIGGKKRIFEIITVI